MYKSLINSITIFLIIFSLFITIKETFLLNEEIILIRTFVLFVITFKEIITNLFSEELYNRSLNIDKNFKILIQLETHSIELVYNLCKKVKKYIKYVIMSRTYFNRFLNFKIIILKNLRQLRILFFKKYLINIINEHGNFNKIASNTKLNELIK